MVPTRLYVGVACLGVVENIVLSRREVSTRQDAMTYLVRVRGLLMDGES